jgi:hypothetical protein
MKFKRITPSIIDQEPTEQAEDLRETARRDAERPLVRGQRPGAIARSPFVQKPGVQSDN